MRVYFVYIEFDDGAVEGVVFSNYDDALMALSGTKGAGSDLANEWCEVIECYEGYSEIKIKELEI